MVDDVFEFDPLMVRKVDVIDAGKVFRQVLNVYFSGTI